MNGLVIAKDSQGVDIAIGSKVAYACLAGYSKRSELRVGTVIGAVISERGTLIRMMVNVKRYDWRSKENTDYPAKRSTYNTAKMVVIG